MMRLPTQQVSMLYHQAVGSSDCQRWDHLGPQSFLKGLASEGFCRLMLHTWQMHVSHLLAADVAGGTVLACAAALFMIRL